MRIYIHFLLCLACLSVALPARADDSVTIATGKEGRGRSKLSGTILDYTGQELKIRQASGRDSVVPADKVIKVDTPKEPRHIAADSLFESGEFGKALDLYREAVREEKRHWMRRQIISQTVWCSHNLGQIERAGDVFLLLAEDDPHTLFFDAIPLCWTSGQPPPGVLRQAKTWLAKESPSAAALLGASWLLSTERATAVSALERLASDGDSRIAQLAEMQLWRTKLVTVKPAEVARWQAAVDRLAVPLRAGPYYLLGEALTRLNNHEQAAVAYLRVPLLYPLNRSLASDALFAAGRELEALGQTAEAANVYRELATDYPTAPRAEEAKRRLEGLKTKADP